MASAVMLGLHFVAGLSWGWSALAGFVGWPIVGIVVTIDDDLSGGWSHPDGKPRPDWLRVRFLGYLLAGVGVSAAASILDGPWASRRTAYLAGAALLAGVASAFLLRGPAAHPTAEPDDPEPRS